MQGQVRPRVLAAESLSCSSGPGRLLGSLERVWAGGPQDGDDSQGAVPTPGADSRVFSGNPRHGPEKPSLKVYVGVCVGQGTIVTQRWFEQRVGNLGAFDSPRS